MTEDPIDDYFSVAKISMMKKPQKQEYCIEKNRIYEKYVIF